MEYNATLAGDNADEGMGRWIGPQTWARCAPYLGDPQARCYELGRMMTSTAPQSPFAAPSNITFEPTRGVPGTIHAHNGELLTGSLTQQGTHLDALGHFASLPAAWDGSGPFPAGQAIYFGGLTQAQVKPDPNAALARLGVEHIRPIVTTAVVLDASAHLAGGGMLAPRQEISAEDIRAMLLSQGLGDRGILKGDAVLVHTGWGARWSDLDVDAYYMSGPGLSRTGAEYIADYQPVLVGLDNPFTDPVCDGQLQGSHGSPPEMQAGAPFGTHHQNLVLAGILQIQNMQLADLVRDGVVLCCIMVLPLRIKGASGSPVRPIAIGAPTSSNGP